MMDKIDCYEGLCEGPFAPYGCILCGPELEGEEVINSYLYKLLTIAILSIMWYVLRLAYSKQI